MWFDVIVALLWSDLNLALIWLRRMLALLLLLQKALALHVVEICDRTSCGLERNAHSVWLVIMVALHVA